MHDETRNIWRGARALLAAAACAIASNAGAVGTRTFTLDTLDDFKGGDLTGVSVDTSGNVRAGLSLGSTPIPDATAVWSAVEVADGSVLLGTGNDGKLYKASGGRADLVAKTGALAISSMAIGWNGDVFLGTFPDGKIFKIPANASGGAQAAVFTALPGVEDIWALAFDQKAKALYAATGPDGKLYRIDERGTAQVYFDSKEPHLVSVAVGDDGAVYTGSNGKALLFKVTGPGRASVLYDFDTDDVKEIVVGKNGTLYVAANKYNEPFASPKRNKLGPPAPQPTRSGKAGHGYLFRVSKDGSAEQLMSLDEAPSTLARARRRRSAVRRRRRRGPRLDRRRQPPRAPRRRHRGAADRRAGDGRQAPLRRRQRPRRLSRGEGRRRPRRDLDEQGPRRRSPGELRPRLLARRWPARVLDPERQHRNARLDLERVVGRPRRAGRGQEPRRALRPGPRPLEPRPQGGAPRGAARLRHRKRARHRHQRRGIGARSQQRHEERHLVVGRRHAEAVADGEALV